jgi:hypothetical protein
MQYAEQATQEKPLPMAHQDIPNRKDFAKGFGMEEAAYPGRNPP